MSPTDRRLVTEAAALLCVARAGLWLLPLRTLRRALDWYGRRDPAPTPVPVVLPAKVAWAIAALSRRLPGPMTCLVQALAADTLLRRYGYAPDLRIGVRDQRDDSKPLEAHAWIECDGTVIVGKLDDLQRFAVLSDLRQS